MADYPESFIWRTCEKCGHQDCIKGVCLGVEEGSFLYGSDLDFCSECDEMRDWSFLEAHNAINE